MKCSSLVITISLALGATSTPALSAWAAAAQKYVPLALPEPKTPPKAWFGKDVRTEKWCAFDKQTYAARVSNSDLSPEEYGWARYSRTGLESITVESQSEDVVKVRFGCDPVG